MELKQVGITYSKKQTMKPCKKCLINKRYATTSLCYGCWKTKEREKKEAKAKARLERKVKSKKYQLGEWRRWHTKAWDAQSQYMRRSKANFQDLVECFTCRKMVHWRYHAQVGHFHHNKGDFYKNNLRIQCDGCNGPRSGETALYATRLVQEIGQEGMVELERYVNTKLYKLEELKEIHAKYSELLKTL
jgi:hypothetical protein